MYGGRRCDRLSDHEFALKKQCHEIIDFRFFLDSVPEYLIKDMISKFSKICSDIFSSRCTTGVTDTGGKWKKSSIRKVLNILLGHPWVVELACRFYFFKFTVFQSDIVPIICHRRRWHHSKFAAGIKTPAVLVENFRWCCWYRWCTLTCEYLSEFLKISKWSQSYCQELWGRWFMQKKLE